ncbi:carbohydrate ABC transporter permease [Cryobacterium sp. TMS1-20-1]|uniref:carbohydrate ABC transporter permease n=1 Tax=Cryobacterium sp. TMS1-20-1 TaxID=1259223 RepID=UPI0018E0AB82|nr:sugar ABC transporter permease [Cryobacterium sp. TMS1-20-1]
MGMISTQVPPPALRVKATQSAAHVVDAKKRNRRRKGRYTGFFFILPALLFIFVFMLYPLVSSGYMSLTEYNFVYDDEPKFIGLDNYVSAFEDPQFVTSLTNTIVFATIFFIILMVVSLSIALFLFQKIRFISFYRSAIFVPLVVPLSLAGLVFLWILQPNYGLLNHVLAEVFNMPFLAQPWLSQSGTAMGSIIALSLWATIGFETILFLAGLQSISPEILEAAELDGARGLKKVFLILLPNLRETYILTATWGILHALKVFVEPMVMTDGGPGTSTLVLYQQVYLTAFTYFDMGYASAMGYILGIIILVLIVLNFLFLRKKGDSGV